LKKKRLGLYLTGLNSTNEQALYVSGNDKESMNIEAFSAVPNFPSS
jgi:hypothetical protein